MLSYLVYTRLCCIPGSCSYNSVKPVPLQYAEFLLRSVKSLEERGKSLVFLSIPAGCRNPLIFFEFWDIPSHGVGSTITTVVGITITINSWHSADGGYKAKRLRHAADEPTTYGVCSKVLTADSSVSCCMSLIRGMYRYGMVLSCLV